MVVARKKTRRRLLYVIIIVKDIKIHSIYKPVVISGGLFYFREKGFGKKVSGTDTRSLPKNPVKETVYK